MLTSFFGKSAPIKFLLLSLLLLIGYVLKISSVKTEGISLSLVVEKILLGGLVVFLMFLLDFIVRKNNLTKKNTYSVLFYVCFVLMLPIIFAKNNILIANLFVLFALRRIFSLRTEKKSNKKILDSSIWIMVASFFYFWSLLFFILLFIAIIRNPQIKYRQGLIPFVGVFTVMIIATAIQLMAFDSLKWFNELNMSISLDFSAYNQLSVLIPVAIISVLIIWTGIARIFMISTVPKKNRPSYILIFFVVSVGILVALASPHKSGAELLFVFAPLSIMTTNYIEMIDEFWFKELLLWLVIVLPPTLAFI